MNQTNTLLKVVSIIYIVLEAIAAVGIVAGSALVGAAFGMGAESVGVGVGAGAIILVVSIGGTVLGLVAGILGVKGYKHITACKVLGIILIVFGVLGALSIFTNDAGATEIALNIFELVLPILYTVGAYKQQA